MAVHASYCVDELSCLIFPDVRLRLSKRLQRSCKPPTTHPAPQIKMVVHRPSPPITLNLIFPLLHMLRPRRALPCLALIAVGPAVELHSASSGDVPRLDGACYVVLQFLLQPMFDWPRLTLPRLSRYSVVGRGAAGIGGHDHHKHRLGGHVLPLGGMHRK